MRDSPLVGSSSSSSSSGASLSCRIGAGGGRGGILLLPSNRQKVLVLPVSHKTGCKNDASCFRQRRHRNASLRSTGLRLRRLRWFTSWSVDIYLYIFFYIFPDFIYLEIKLHKICLTDALTLWNYFLQCVESPPSGTMHHCSTLNCWLSGCKVFSSTVYD